MKKTDLFNAENTGAEFSSCRKYRYILWRIWDKDKPRIMFIGLNPSTANESNNDPTIRRVQKFAFDWGFGGVYMLNLFAYITPYPKELKKDINSSRNDFSLIHIADKCEKIIFAWGSFKEANERANEVMKLFDGYALMIIRTDLPNIRFTLKKILYQ